MSHRPLVVAHRGYSGRYPENTLSAFSAALKPGVDGVEMDIQTSADGHLIVCHDTTVDRTTDSQGRIGSLTLERIRSFDAGSWFDPHFAGERVPTLPEVLDLLQGRATPFIEVKEPGYEGLLARLLEDRSLVSGVVVISFWADVLRRLQDLLPGLRLGFLTVNPSDLARVLEMQIPVLSIQHDAVSEELVDRAHRQRVQVSCWTANDPRDIARLIDLGVDAITSDHPDRVLEALGMNR